MRAPEHHQERTRPEPAASRDQLTTLLSKLLGPVQSTPASKLTSAVTTAWGVDWDETFIARDLLQNFFDANREDLAKVEVRVIGNDVLVKAPAGFQLQRLFFLGSETDDVGHYGEGFKVAATCLLRDHEVTPIVVSGRDAVLLRIASEPVAGTTLRPLVYEFHRLDREILGCVLILPGCRPKLVQAMQVGLDHFLHDGNPLVGALRWSSWCGGFAVHESKTSSGHVFYRNLKRGEIPNIPVVLVIAGQHAVLEKKIGRDRDRNAFGEALLRQFYRTFAQKSLRDAQKGQRAILELARPMWRKGHALLAEVASSCIYRAAWTPQQTKDVFGDGYYATAQSTAPADQLEVDAIEANWRKAGRVALPGYFVHIGVPNAHAHRAELRRKALEEARDRQLRPPTVAEKAGLEVLARVLDQLSPGIVAVLRSRSITYSVAATDALLGELREGRTYRSTDVFFSTRVFLADFAAAVSVYLHEHAHIFGYDGARSFGDALTELLESTIGNRGWLDGFEAQWNKARKLVHREQAAGPDEAAERRSWLEKLPVAELRALVGLPAEVWAGLRARGSGERTRRCQASGAGGGFRQVADP